VPGHLLDARARLQLMGLLHRHRDVSARAARKALGLTDGNLASHAARLEEAGWLESRRALSPSGFEVRYRVTPAGSAAFREHVTALRRLLDGFAAGADGDA
jgi:DNA-binding MarR family transcriptional regulator